MPKSDTLDRREFTLQSILAVLAGVSVTLTGCAGESPTQPTYTDVAGTVGSNHGHTVVITAAQLTAGGGVVLDIQGTSSHPHQVELTAGDVAAVRDGRRVSKDSTPSPSGSHAHTVTFN